jgi:hypothetical protein
MATLIITAIALQATCLLLVITGAVIEAVS